MPDHAGPDHAGPDHAGARPLPLPAGPPAVLLFDFDGVLVESTAIKTGAFEAIYADADPGLRARLVAWHRRHGGISRVEKFRRFEAERLGRPATDAEIDALSARFAAQVETAVTACAPIPGAVALLDRAAAAGLPCHVVSGTPEAELQRIVIARGWAGRFRTVRGAPALKPAILRDLLAAGGHPPGQAVMVGDSLTDHDAAVDVRTGFLGIAGRDGRHPFPPGIPVLADLTAAAGLLRLP